MLGGQRHGSKQVIYESYPELGYNYRLTDLQAAIGVSNCNGFSRSSRGGGSLRRNKVSAFAQQLAKLATWTT
ncbi:MAG: hypothetical protein E5Y32_02130 [Mesorhizobium sp.]|uniref:DegT/DnrJ/EryC1/StrS family aminotransferase n=1 Tax=Mesorhizobium sp. TaxID=1871066 RepID=UPI000FE82F88|nr:MAG: hypothetical protein EOS13_08640 [Mesorhizobium sp.]TIN49362.1 MAG: hypothetical protein E5Y32_02130 [Mesorhizobium sp.]